MSLGRTLARSTFKTLRYQILRQTKRTAFTAESDDRDLDVPKGTHLNFLNDPDEELPHLYINKYSKTGFKLSTGVNLTGPIVFFPRSFLSWKIKNVDDLNEESLSLFKAIHPKLDILLIGTGSEKASVSKEVIKFLRENKINFEILTTEKAIPTFNFLSAEQRWVAAALIPPSNIVDSLSLEIKKHLEAVDTKARLESEDDEYIQLTGDTNTSKQLDFEEKINMALSKARYWKGSDENSPTTEKAAKSTDPDLQVKEQAMAKPPSSSGIRYVSRSDYLQDSEDDPKLYIKEYLGGQGSKEIKVEKSPLDTSWQRDSDVSTTVSRQRTDKLAEADKDNNQTSDKADNPTKTK